ncbi:MAG: beta-galactosidase [Deinococcus sp.]|nr:beta-galactosidase [Deinococcus sp.]
MKLGFFPLGSSYYPPHHDPADWERDVKRMARSGLNAMRTAELLATWDIIEREPRQPDFSWVDQILDLCAKHSLRVLLGTGACCPPVWMLDEYPDLPVISRDGVPYPTRGTWSWACIDHSGYLKETDRYLNQLLERYKDHPALLGWQIHNEAGYPFIPQKGKEMDWYCYCPHTTQRFRQWLKRKYQTIEALTDAWRWDPTNARYQRFEQVQPPRAMPIEWGPVTAWLDWRTFCAENWAAFIQRQHDLIKQKDPKHPTTTNLWGEATDYVGALAIDPWKLAQVVDVLGYDLYPGLKKRGVPERRRDALGPFFVSYFLDFARSTCAHNGKPFWLPEIESGPLDGWVKGPRYATRGRDLKRWNLEALAHGAKMILYQGYREWNCIPIHWGALVDLHGEPTERYYAAKEVNQAVKANEQFFIDAEPVPAQVALFYSQDNVFTMAGMSADDFMRRALQGAYEALWTSHHPVDFVSPQHLAQTPYRVIFLPFAAQLSPATCQQLKSFVRRGGILVGFAKCAMLDERGWYYNTRPGGGLDQVFGVREDYIAMEDQLKFTAHLNGRDYETSGFHHHQFLHLDKTTQVLGQFSDGTPALTHHAYGRGQAYYFATHFDMAALGSRAHAEVFHQLLEECRVTRPVLIKGRNSELVDVHLAQSGDEHLLVITNEGTQAAVLTLELPGITFSQAKELFGSQVQLKKGQAARLQVTVDAQDGAAIRLA